MCRVFSARRRKCMRSDPLISVLLAAIAAGRAMTTMSIDPSCSASLRNTSRARRFSLFRATARRTCLRAIASPRRGESLPCPRAASTVKNRSEERKACRKTAAKSAALSKRRLRGKSWANAIRREVVFEANPWGNRSARRQADAAFGATCVDHLAAATSGHAGAKTMGPGAFDAAGLKGTFHGHFPGSAVRSAWSIGSAPSVTGRAISK